MKKSLILLASALFVLLGCQTNRNDHQGKTVFRYNEASGISSLDPAFARGQADVWACNQIYNGLLQLDDSLRIKPSIAKRFTISEDGLEYRFTLRNDVFFQHNEAFSGGKGRVVTAHDFVYSFNRILDPKTLSPGTWVFNQVLRDADGKPHVVAIDDTTLNIRLAKPFPPFLGLLTMQYCSVVPIEAVEKYGKEFRKNPVGTGPFKLFYWEERVGLVLHKNDNYFEIENGVRLPLVDAVSVSFLSDKQAAFMEFVKGKLDFISGIDASYKDELLDRDGNLEEKYRTAFQMRKAPYLNTEYLGILMDSKSEVNPLTNVLIRKAINHGFDRERMIRFLR
ncbi:MAG: ABC transporter substrate-binding protein, partial [Bacteroidota bacterium]